ncbi:Glycosyltransferase involved in cell wall bisynthesis [Ruegeria halocynthiae]|uniref:Glycosyltransferase involved in cell wall bisynthesis n=1 Tax=Ruegeria halocynthiae TaxID=985054 RepID=A0A1H2YDV1_9RHOB|nr:glycosyltransferase [Ruegeria halocynthiae]SDX03383.1 Glycosyltransferase involved in cell wall bisynthesis [Ruegeria halocynthiae]
MKFAYFMNTYPMTSTTFIRREIAAHEEAGFEVKRFAIRRWNQELSDPKDREEEQSTSYILEQGVCRLLMAFLREMLTNPVGLFRAIRGMVHMARNATNQRWKQIAYLLEAVYLKQTTLAQEIGHLHVHFSTNSASVALLSYLMGGPSYSVTIHGPDELYDMGANSLGLKTLHASFIAVITDYCFQIVDTHTESKFTNKIYLVRCGINADAFSATPDYPAQQEYVCVGRLCEAKAQHVLVEAFSEIVAENPEANLILIGDGDQRHLVESTIKRLNLGRNVELAGWRSNQEVLAAIKSARALLLPSLAEGLPVVIMESFALGRPVLTTRINGIPELVDEACGWLADPGNKESLVECLKSLLSKDVDELSSMGQIGRERVLKLHNQSNNAKRLRDIILSQEASI